MSASLRTDSPVLPTFPRRLSAAAPALTCIAEQPRQQVPVLNSSTTITSPEDSSPNPNYTFFDDSSSTSSTHSSSDALPPMMQMPSCLKFEDLGYESAGDSDWTVGWEVSSHMGEMGQKVKLLEQDDLPEIRDGDFMYYPQLGMKCWEGEDGDGSLKLARRRLEKRGENAKRGGGFKHFLEALLEKMGWSIR